MWPRPLLVLHLSLRPLPRHPTGREKDNLSGDYDRDDHQQSADLLSVTLAGECVYTKGDTVIAHTLATHTPEAHAMMLLGKKMNNPWLSPRRVSTLPWPASSAD